MLRAYLAGPDVFLPNAAEHAARKVAICARHGFDGLSPFNEETAALTRLPADEAWRAIFATCIEMMESADLIIANLTPFRGPSADAGTLVELGWFLARNKPIFAYSNTATAFAERTRAHLAAIPDPVPGLAVEEFGLPDNLMIPGAARAAGGRHIVLPEDGRHHAFDAFDVFESCVETAATTLG
jgi:nucleoside 2-deoxyribosyltransferase